MGDSKRARAKERFNEIMSLGHACMIDITGDPYESRPATFEVAMRAIRECLRLGQQDRNELRNLQAQMERQLANPPAPTGEVSG